MEVPLSQDGGAIAVIFKLEEVSGGVFQKKGRMLQPAAGESAAGLLIKSEPFSFRPVGQLLPFGLGREDEAEVAGVDPLLRIGALLRGMGDQLMSSEAEGQGKRGFPPQRTAEPIDIKLLGPLEIDHRKSKVKQTLA